MAEKPTYEELERQITLLENASAQGERFEEINDTLFKISSAVNMTSNLDELFRKIHLALSPVIDATNFYIALYDKTKDRITFPYCVDTADACYPQVIEVSKTASLTAEVIQTGRPVWVTNAEILDQRAKSSLKIPARTPSENWLGVPLKTRDEIIGAMAVQSYHDPKCYDQTDMNLMISVADQVAFAVERKRAGESMRKSEALYRLMVKRRDADVIRMYPAGCERILLVDDEAPIVNLEKIMLDRLGYQVTARTSSLDALAVFKADPNIFDLVISDRGMPGMTGDQLAGELMSIRPGIPIILCAGFWSEKDVQRARATGVKGFLIKPVATGDLAEMVRKVLDDLAGGAPVYEPAQAEVASTA